MIQQDTPRSLRNFSIIWFGQLISVFGSGLSSFALGVWVYQRTNSVTQYALISLFTILPGILFSPLAGPAADRWDRRRLMIVSDAGAALCTLALAILFFTGRIEPWHIYLLSGLSATFNTFQWPAYAASIALLVPKQHLVRANGMVQTAQAVGQLLTPALAGVLLLALRLEGILLIDMVTFFFAVSTLLFVRIPRLVANQANAPEKRSFLTDFSKGWEYLVLRPGLLAILGLYGASNLMIGVVTVLATPLILAITSSSTLGMVITIGGSGMLLGSVFIGVWGGPKRRIYGMFVFMLLEGLAILMAGLSPSIPLFTLAAFLFFLALPIDAGCSQAVLQSKVPLDMQGRVFAVQRMIARSCLPISYIISGPLADFFEPLMSGGGYLANTIGRLIGTGPGRGIGLLFILFGALYLCLTVGSYLYPRLRFVEDELPDVLPSQNIPKPDGEIAEIVPTPL